MMLANFRLTGNKHFDVHFRRIKSFNFLSKDENHAMYERGKGSKNVFSLPQSALFVFKKEKKLLFFFSFSIW